MTQELDRLIAATVVADWHDSIGSGPIEELNTELGELQAARRAYLALRAQGDSASTLDHIAWAQNVRAEHEATHGEAEMCGADCIVLGLTEFDAGDSATTEGAVLREVLVFAEIEHAMVDGEFRISTDRPCERCATLDRWRALLADVPDEGEGA